MKATVTRKVHMLFCLYRSSKYISSRRRNLMVSCLKDPNPIPNPLPTYETLCYLNDVNVDANPDKNKPVISSAPSGLIKNKIKMPNEKINDQPLSKYLFSNF